MKTSIVQIGLPLAAISLFAIVAMSAGGEGARYETVACGPTPPTSGSISIADYETGEIVTALRGSFSVSKDGMSVPVELGTVVRGPATFTVQNPADSSLDLLTVKITPVSFPPNQTAIVPAGTNQVQVVLESSTNLVNWVTATNGIYGSPTVAEFFRIRLTTLNP